LHRVDVHVQVLPVLQERFPIQRARMRLRLQVSSTARLPWFLASKTSRFGGSDFALSWTPKLVAYGPAACTRAFM
jgi:hypothetical protein